MSYSPLLDHESGEISSSDESTEDSNIDYDVDCQIVKGANSDEVLFLSGYKDVLARKILFHLLCILSGGALYLIAYWRPDWKMFMISRSSSLRLANKVILKDIDGVEHVVDVVCETVQEFSQDYKSFYIKSWDGERTFRYFIFQYMKYAWNDGKGEFECLMGFSRDISVKTLLHKFRGFPTEERSSREVIFGSNCITIETKSCWSLFFTEVLNPFYVFQIASLILWCLDEYYLYALCIFIVSCLSIAVSLVETKRQSRNLKMMVESSNTKSVFILRPNESEPVEVDASTVVPGDVLLIPTCGGVMPCDAVLIMGTAIVNESMLTGESIPVTKVALTTSEENEMYHPENHKRNTLFCGTNVIQTRYYGNEQVLAVVVRTGFSTAKGELVRSILYPRSIDFQFYRDAMKFILILFGVSLVGMAYSVYTHVIHAKSVRSTVLRTLDIVTIVVPPALPAAMTVGTYYAQNRLKKLGIFCISPPRINISGKIKLFCFDKTGTLTEDGLEVCGVVGVEETKNPDNSVELHLGAPSPRADSLNPRDPLAIGLASCHSLTYIDGVLTGDPLDISMFNATKWELIEPENDSENFDSLIPTLVRPSSKILSVPSAIQVSSTSTDTDQHSPECGLAMKELSRPTSVSGSITSADEIFSGIFSRLETSSPLLENIPGGSKEVPVAEPSERGTDRRLTKEVLEPESSERGTEHPGSDFVETKTGRRADGCTCRKEHFHPTITIEQVPFEVGIVRQFPFSSSLQRMSVIVRVLGSNQMELFCKGAPEKIQGFCKTDTIPINLAEVLSRFTLQGFRVIALARKILPPKFSWRSAQRIKRDQIECDLSFMGLLVMQNVLKPETSPVIRQLIRANIRTVIVTGDNILTAVSVARDCGMIGETDKVFMTKIVRDVLGRFDFTLEPTSESVLETSFSSQDLNGSSVKIDIDELRKHASDFHIAVTGSDWAIIKDFYPDYVPYIVSSGTVFGRMSPDQKVQLVEELMALGFVVGMCGDGANDCGALKAAHVGISLSEAEASVAAPFTSHVANITCVPKLICEGRGALATNFSVFKYMTLYSIIQFVSVLILYSACTNLSDPQFLYIDLFIVTLVAIFMGYTKAEHQLVRERPLSSLVGVQNLFSVFSQVLLVIAMQVFTFLYLQMQWWYESPVDNCVSHRTEDESNTWDTNVIFCVSSFQYLSLAVIYSPGKPFRKPLYSNEWLLTTILLFTGSTLWLLLHPPTILESFMHLKTFPFGRKLVFRFTLLGIVALHFVVGWSVEYFFAGSRILKAALRCVSPKTAPKNHYKRVRLRMDSDTSWPPFSRPLRASAVD